jgi:CheY-like chemotaxis protein
MKILIIEDDPAHLKLANLVLTAEGHEVTDAYTAEQAIESVSGCPPQIILLDLALPGTDGFALARRLKEAAETREIPIVAVTAYPERFSREEAQRAGCEAYIVKPIDTRKLADQVEAAARQHGPE